MSETLWLEIQGGAVIQGAESVNLTHDHLIVDGLQTAIPNYISADDSYPQAANDLWTAWVPLSVIGETFVQPANAYDGVTIGPGPDSYPLWYSMRVPDSYVIPAGLAVGGAATWNVGDNSDLTSPLTPWSAAAGLIAGLIESGVQAVLLDSVESPTLQALAAIYNAASAVANISTGLNSFFNVYQGVLTDAIDQIASGEPPTDADFLNYEQQIAQADALENKGLQEIEWVVLGGDGTVFEVTDTGFVTASPVLTGLAAVSIVSNGASSEPFASVTISDTGANQTETVTITLATPANGPLYGIGTYIVRRRPKTTASGRRATLGDKQE